MAVIFKNDGNKAAYVVYAGADLGSAVSSEDVVYLVGDQDFDINTRKTPPTPSCGSWTA